MAPYCSNRNTNCYCQNGNYRPQTRQENERQLHCNIPVPPLPEQKAKNYCCDECVGDYSKTDVKKYKNNSHTQNVSSDCATAPKMIQYSLDFGVSLRSY